MKLSKYILLLLLLSLTFQDTALTVTADSLTVSTPTLYKFSFMSFDTTVVPASSKVVIVFPT